MDVHWRHVKRRYHPDDPFFEEGNLRCNMIIKRIPEDEHEGLLTRVEEFVCNVSGCNKTFTTISSYETHYNGSHRHVCMECHRRFASNHLLDIHILEWHDVMFQLLAAKQKMFQCLVEDCRSTFSDSKERKDHLIQVHKYPSSFRFHRNQTHKKKDENEDKANGDKARKFSYKVPTTICFGQGATRGFQRPHWKKNKRKDWHQGKQTSHTKMDIENVDLNELASALDQPSSTMEVDNTNNS